MSYHVREVLDRIIYIYIYILFLCITQMFMCRLLIYPCSSYSLAMFFFKPGAHSVLSKALPVHLFTHLFLSPFRHFPSTSIEVFFYSFIPYCPFTFHCYNTPKPLLVNSYSDNVWRFFKFIINSLLHFCFPVTISICRSIYFYQYFPFPTFLRLFPFYLSGFMMRRHRPLLVLLCY